MLMKNQTYENPSYRVRFFFIRHGQSCSNIAKEFPINKIYKNLHLQSMNYRDPELSMWGLNYTTKNGVRFKKWLDDNNIILHHIGASSMLRAMQTAWYMLSKSGINTTVPKVKVLPYVSEKKIGGGANLPRWLTDNTNVTASNNPLPFEEQLEFLQKDPTKFKGMVSALDPLVINETERFESSLPKFLEWFEEKVGQFFKDANLDPQTDIMNFAIVCHGTFIRKELKLEQKGVPSDQITYNNSVFTKQYIFNKAKQIDYGAERNYPESIDQYCPNSCRKSYIPCKDSVVDSSIQGAPSRPMPLPPTSIQGTQIPKQPPFRRPMPPPPVQAKRRRNRQITSPTDEDIARLRQMTY